MENPALILKPNLMNALFPTLIKNTFYSSIIILVLSSGIYLASLFKLIDQQFEITTKLILSIIFITLVIACIPLIIKIIILYNTKYYFYHGHLISEFELFIVKRHSVPYNKIVNIQLKVSLWDRICNSGNLILHTAEDKTEDIHLNYIKNPTKIEHYIYELIHKIKTSEKQNSK